MYLHDLGVGWTSHPFWRNAFLLKDGEDVQLLLESGIEEVVIDTSKGLDVELDSSWEEGGSEIHPELMRAASRPGRKDEHTSLAEEIQRAATICARSKEAVVSMFREARMGKAIDAEKVLPLVEEIYSSVVRNPAALISIARVKTSDEYTYLHSVAVCGLMMALARQLRLGEDMVRDAGLAGLVHDVGKVAIPIDILNKPGKLTNEEFELVKTHPVEGHRMLLEGKGIPDAALDVCLHHHEKTDGSGYPDQLSERSISLFSEICAVCDVYDATTSDRPYRRAWDPGIALHRMAGWSSGHFETSVFHAFVRSVGIYPVGSLVRLQSRRLGVVVDQSRGSLLKPTVKVFYSVKSRSSLPHEVLDLASSSCDDEIAALEDPAKWQFPDLNELWQGSLASS